MSQSVLSAQTTQQRCSRLSNIVEKEIDKTNGKVILTHTRPYVHKHTHTLELFNYPAQINMKLNEITRQCFQ